MLKEYNEMKEEIKKIKDLIKFREDFNLFIKQCDHIVWGVETIHKNPKVARTKNERLMLISKCSMWDSKNLQLIKEASGLLK